MKIFKNRIFKSLIIIPVIVMLLLFSIFPSKVYATKSQDSIITNFFDRVGGSIKGFLGFQTDLDGNSQPWSWDGIGGNLLKEIMWIIVALGDIVISLLQVTMIGDSDFWASTMITNKNDNLEDTSSWLYADQSDIDALQSGSSNARGNMAVVVADSGLRNGIFFGDTWQVPNIIYSPETIFSNKIAALDANFINPNTFRAVTDSDEAERESVSLAKKVSPTIASWYRAFRNLAIVSLLTMLVYIGIRIVIGSTAGEKAKYKERLQDWFVALCLIFFMHFIMAAIMMFSEAIIRLFDQTTNSGIIIGVDDGTVFRTNFTGYVRFIAQSNAWTLSMAYGIMYIIIVSITLKFTFIYLKRFLYLAFFTMIAPLIALTYPLDKMSDGKAQAYNKWFKEYFINAMLQPMHLILYTALVSSASTLCMENPIYGIVVMMFISTAEDWIKKLFRLDEAKLTSSTMADVAMMGGIAKLGANAVKMVGGAIGGPALSLAAKAAPAVAGFVGGPVAGLATKAGSAVAGIFRGAAGAATGVASGLMDSSTDSGPLGTDIYGGGGDYNIPASGDSEAADAINTGIANGGIQLMSPEDLTENMGQPEWAPTDMDQMDWSDANDTTDLGGLLYGDNQSTGRSMATSDIQNRLNVPRNDSPDDGIDIVNYQDYDSDDNQSGDNTGNSGTTSSLSNNQNISGANLADQISQGITAGLKSVFDERDQKEEEKKQKEKEKEEERNKIEFASQPIKSGPARFLTGAAKAGVTLTGAVGGAALGMAVSAFRGEDYGKTALAMGLGGVSLAGGFNNLAFNALRDKKKNNFDKLKSKVPKDDLADVGKVDMLRKAASMAALNNWSEEKTLASYNMASLPQYQDMASKDEVKAEFEKFMKDHNPSATDKQIKKAMKEITDIQAGMKKIKGVRK